MRNKSLAQAVVPAKLSTQAGMGAPASTSSIDALLVRAQKQDTLATEAIAGFVREQQAGEKAMPESLKGFR
ncbi:MAG: hypothetical protein AB7L90_25895 [Hyphomicrobiaceae bacterium]